jgi:predicted secreted protein
MKQTAVDYIKEKLMCNEYWYENMTFDQIFDQAEKMEREQIIKAYNTSFLLRDKPYSTAEKYYNETYENNN